MSANNLPSVLGDWNAEMIKTLKQTVAQGLTDAEFMLFAGHCRSTRLDPRKKEVWAIKAGGRLQLMTSNAGFHTIANSHPQYDGIETGFVGQGGEYLPLAYPGSDYIGAWAKVYRKDRRIPHEAVAMLEEYDKKQGNWKTMPRIMIVKCAESIALRKAFPQEMNGLYTAEEMPAEYGAPRQQGGNEYDRLAARVKPNPQPVIDVTPEPQDQPGPFYYRLIGDLGDDTKEKCVALLEAAKASWDSSVAAWRSPIELKKLVRMRFDPDAEAIAEAMGDDDLPDWNAEKGA